MTTEGDYDVVVWSMEDVMPEKPKRAMREVAISEFKTKCLSLLKEVSKTRTPLRVTRRGKATADVIPTSFETEQKGWIGSMSDTIEIVRDIVSPIVDSELSEPLTEP
jgi:prevent-host-death family protein